MSTSTERDEAWAAVWNDRDESRADWNGCEACFETPDAYLDWVRGVADLVTAELELSSADDVLDLGCGSGRVAEAISPRVHSILAVDYSKPALAVAVKKRSAANITYEWADLNSCDPALFANRNKAYAVGSMFYLKSTSYVLELAGELTRAGIDVMLLDLPDADLEDVRARAYDQQKYSHLQFRESDFLELNPRIRFVRGRFPEYANDAYRFSVVIPAS